MRKIFLFILLSCVAAVNAQDIEMPSLTKEQMRQDVEFLVQAIKEIEPNIPIREKVTGTKIYDEINKLAQSVDTISSFESFYYLTQRILLLCQDQHEDIRQYPAGLENNNYYIDAQAIERTKYSNRKYDPFMIIPTPIQYVNGNFYYSANSYLAHNMKTVVLPAKAQILKIGDIDVDYYVATWNRLKDNSIRWDFKNKKYYTNRFYSPEDVGLNIDDSHTYQINDSIITLHFMEDLGIVGWHCDFKNLFAFQVQYFGKEKILYIRIPSMDEEQIPYLQKNILKYKNRQISKVVIDIRYNGGGSDWVWEEVISSIIDKPIISDSRVYYKNTPLVVDYVTKIRESEIVKTFQINGENYFSTSETENDTISPDSVSLNYNGKIYVLVNEKIFSSSLAFVSVCKQAENLVTVGTATGYMCGRSTTPFFLSLPNSKLIFELVPCIDMSGNKNNPEDFYDFQAEIPVNLTIDDYVFEMEYKGKRYGKDFLYNHDPIFQKVLEMK